MATIASLNVFLRAKTGHFKKGMRLSSRIVTAFRRRLLSLSSTLIGVGGAAGFAFLVKRQLEAIDVTAKLSDRIGVATEDLIRLRHAAQIMGVEAAGLDKSLEIFVRRLGEVQLGTGEAERGLELLGLTAKDLAAAGPSDAFKVIAERIALLTDNSQKAAAAYFLFGRQGTKLLNLLNLGRMGIQQLADEADKLGIVFSREAAAKVEEANDAMTRLGAVARGLGQTLAIELAPFIEAAAIKLTDMATEGEGVGQRMVSLLEDVLRTLDIIGRVGKVVLSVFHAVKSVVAGILSVIALIPAAIEGFIRLIPGLEGKMNVSFAIAKGLKNEVETGLADAARAAIEAFGPDTIGPLIDKIRKAADEAAKKAIARPPSGLIPLDLEELAAQQKAFLKATKDAKRIFEKTRTPIEKYEAQIDKLNNFLKLGIITWDTYGRAVKDALKKFDAPAIKIFEQTRTPLEQYSKKITELDELLKTGAISWDTYGRAVRMAHKELQGKGPGEFRTFKRGLIDVRGLGSFEARDPKLAVLQDIKGQGEITNDLLRRGIGAGVN